MIVAMLAATVLLADSTTALQATPTQSPPAGQTTAAATPAPKKQAGNQADLICKSEAVLGSRMPVRKCRTSAQAAQDKLDAQAELERAQGANANNPH